MKCIPAFSVIAALGVVSCETMNAPLSTGGDFDPLRPPGSNANSASAADASFKAGQFVQTLMNNTSFFKTRPRGDADADKLLNVGTSMKVISVSGSYLKVELDSGEVGFVPSIMVQDANAAAQVSAAAPNEFQIYPPVPGAADLGVGEPLPVIDPAGLPPAGAIPTVIDPEAPAAPTPVPWVTPTTDTFPAPVEPKVESLPLPPTTSELEKLDTKTE